MRATVVVLDHTKSHVAVIERFKEGRHYYVFLAEELKLVNCRGKQL